LLRQLSAKSGADSVSVLTRLAHNAADKLNDADRALVYLHQVLEADGENREAFGETERILASLERWHELVDVLERRAEIEAAAGHAEAELTCRVAVASIWGEKLGAAGQRAAGPAGRAGPQSPSLPFAAGGGADP